MSYLRAFFLLTTRQRSRSRPPSVGADVARAFE